MNVTIARTVILYVFVILAIRLMGKRQIGDMQPNELVITHSLTGSRTPDFGRRYCNFYTGNSGNFNVDSHHEITLV